MKKLLFLWVLWLWVGACWGINIAYVSSQKVFDSHPEAKKAKEILQKEIENGNREIKIREKEIMSLQEELKKPLSDEAKRRKEATIQAKIEELETYQQEAVERLGNKKKELEEQITIKIRNIIKDIAKEKKINLVLDNDIVVYGEDAFDITDEVIERIKNNSDKNKK